MICFKLLEDSDRLCSAKWGPTSPNQTGGWSPAFCFWTFPFFDCMHWVSHAFRCRFLVNAKLSWQSPQTSFSPWKKTENSFWVVNPPRLWCIPTEGGQVYVFGNGDWGQLGIGNPKNFHEKAERQRPAESDADVGKSLRCAECCFGFAKRWGWIAKWTAVSAGSAIWKRKKNIVEIPILFVTLFLVAFSWAPSRLFLADQCYNEVCYNEVCCNRQDSHSHGAHCTAEVAGQPRNWGGHRLRLQLGWPWSQNNRNK